MQTPKTAKKKLFGLKITTVGFICVILGLLVFVLIDQSIGKLIIYLGFIIGFVGMITHFCILFSKTAEPETKQPPN